LRRRRRKQQTRRLPAFFFAPSGPRSPELVVFQILEPRRETRAGVLSGFLAALAAVSLPGALRREVAVALRARP
jgi:hypothetical protein